MFPTFLHVNFQQRHAEIDAFIICPFFICVYQLLCVKSLCCIICCDKNRVQREKKPLSASLPSHINCCPHASSQSGFSVGEHGDKHGLNNVCGTPCWTSRRYRNTMFGFQSVCWSLPRSSAELISDYFWFYLTISPIWR